MAEVECMTLEEYAYRMKAYALTRVDIEYDMHMQAWLNVQAGSTKKKGKETVPKFKDFKEFFDYEKQVQSVLGARKSTLTNQQKRMAEAAIRANK